MSRKLILFFFVFNALMLIGQSDLTKASEHFNRFEYGKAAKILNEAWSKNRDMLGVDERKQLIYANFVIGNYLAANEPLKWLIESKHMEPYFYFIQGEVYRALGFYEEALASYDFFESTDGTIDLTMYRLSCLEAFTWGNMIVDYEAPLAFNHSKASLIAQNSPYGLVVLKEVGFDAKQNRVSNEVLHLAEYFVMRPYLWVSDTLKQIHVEQLDPHFSVVAMAFHPLKKEALVAVVNPLATSPKEQKQRIYEATFQDESNVLLLGKEWEVTKLSDVSVSMPTFHPKGDLVVYAQMDPVLHTSDLYAAYRIGDEWSKPQPLVSLNTDEDEMYPLFISDSLFSFASNGRVGYGGLDIYTAFFKQGQFEDVVHWLAPINSPRDDFAFIYLPELDSAIFTTNRYCNWEDDNVFGVKFGEIQAFQETELTEAQKEKNRKVKAFFDQWDKFIIYFDFDKFQLKEKAKEVQDMIEFLSQNEDFEIILTGHTDNRGSTKYNYKLGLKRAQSVKERLLAIGISPDQIQLTSKGKNDPLFDCSGGCKEKQHALNRAVVVDVKQKILR